MVAARGMASAFLAALLTLAVVGHGPAAMVGQGPAAQFGDAVSEREAFALEHPALVARSARTTLCSRAPGRASMSLPGRQSERRVNAMPAQSIRIGIRTTMSRSPPLASKPNARITRWL